MSGTIGDNVYRASGVIASAAGGGLDWQTIVTGSTMTAVAGNGYWIDTTSNACTITLPATASDGDEIMFVDYARKWGTNGIVIDSNGLNYQSDDDTFDVEYGTDGTALHIVYSGATNGWIPTLDKAVDDAPSKGNQEGIFGYGYDGSNRVSMTNLVSNTGVVATDVTGVGTARQALGACEYGGDKGIFGFGNPSPGVLTNVTNLVSNTGVVASDQAATTGTIRYVLAACSFGGDKGIFGFGSGGSAISNIVSNAGVVAADVANSGTAREIGAACEYGTDTAIFGFGAGGYGVTNLVTNVGVIGSDVAEVGTARVTCGACSYGFDKGIFFGGDTGSVTDITNLVSNTGVIQSDGTGVGTARHGLGGTQYNGDKGIFGFGSTGSAVAISNLVSNVGVLQSDQAATTGTARYYPAACSFN